MLVVAFLPMPAITAVDAKTLAGKTNSRKSIG
jgi:hypothetical protein